MTEYRKVSKLIAIEFVEPTDDALALAKKTQAGLKQLVELMALGHDFLENQASIVIAAGSPFAQIYAVIAASTMRMDVAMREWLAAQGIGEDAIEAERHRVLQDILTTKGEEIPEEARDMVLQELAEGIAEMNPDGTHKSAPMRVPRRRTEEVH